LVSVIGMAGPPFRGNSLRVGVTYLKNYPCYPWMSTDFIRRDRTHKMKKALIFRAFCT
jgi:hypothetical protein